jgi:hypothetical protein
MLLSGHSLYIIVTIDTKQSKQELQTLAVRRAAVG